MTTWESMKQATLPKGLDDAFRDLYGTAVDEVWENDEFLCTVRYEPVTGGLVGRDGLLYLTIVRLNGEPIGQEENVTRVKDDVVETSRLGLVQSEDDINKAHVWVMPEGIALPDAIERGTR